MVVVTNSLRLVTVSGDDEVDRQSRLLKTDLHEQKHSLVWFVCTTMTSRPMILLLLRTSNFSYQLPPLLRRRQDKNCIN